MREKNMALPLRFDILAPQVVPYTAQVERWQELEAYGFDSLWFADHFVNPDGVGHVAHSG